jgi:hypothetical protein
MVSVTEDGSRMTRSELKEARGELMRRLEGVLGPETPGVSGVGVGLDPSGDTFSLTVLFNGVDRAFQMLEKALPATIRGLPVHVSQRGTGRLE